FAYYFLMSFNLSSTYLSYIGMTFFWLLGSLVGLWIKETGLERWLLLANTFSFYVFAWLSFNLRFNNQLYYFFFALVAVAGVFPGYFFAQNHKRTRKVKWLLFMENNGFIMGMVLSFGLFSYWGIDFLYTAPVIFTVCLWLFEFWLPDGTIKLTQHKKKRLKVEYPGT
ncbi:MAG: hypothetical protein ACE5GM_11245, partial [bacterium]